MTTIFSATSTAFDIFHQAVDMVIAAENAQDLCRRIVHSDTYKNVVRGASIFTLNNRSNLFESACYGEAFAEGISEISAWDENPASNSVRTKELVFEPGDSAKGRAGIVSMPLLKDSIPVGALVLIVDPDTKESPFSKEISPAIGKLCAYFLETRGLSASSPASTNGKESIEDLTTRQITILGFMGDGMTNAEISTKVLLSESTVRQETIRIYRALAVPGRQEAVAKARALGLIKKISFANPPLGI